MVAHPADPGGAPRLIAAHWRWSSTTSTPSTRVPAATSGNVVGYPLFPVYMAKAGGFFFIVFGVIPLMGGLMQINPVWVFGPYNPAQVTAGSQPDWYMGFVEGASGSCRTGSGHRARPGRGTS